MSSRRTYLQIDSSFRSRRDPCEDLDLVRSRTSGKCLWTLFETDSLSRRRWLHSRDHPKWRLCGSNGNGSVSKRTCFEFRPGTPYDTGQNPAKTPVQQPVQVKQAKKPIIPHLFIKPAAVRCRGPKGFVQCSTFPSLALWILFPLEP